MKPSLILIGGPSGSGKTCVATELANALGDCAHLHIDDYYQDLAHVPFEKRAAKNFDHPDALDWALLLEHVAALREGRAIECPQYDFASHTRKPTTSTRSSATHVLLDGIHALYHEELAAAAAVSVYVTATREMCFDRRRERDVAERGRTEESIRQQFDTHVWPMAEQFVLPSRARAHVVVEGEGSLADSVQQILDRLAKATQR